MNETALAKMNAAIAIFGVDSELYVYKEIIEQYRHKLKLGDARSTRVPWYGFHPSDDTTIIPVNFGESRFKFLRVFSDVLPSSTKFNSLSDVCYFEKIGLNVAKLGFNFKLACECLQIEPDNKLLDVLLTHKQAFLYFGFLTWVKDSGLNYFIYAVGELRDKVENALIMPLLRADVSVATLNRIYDILNNK